MSASPVCLPDPNMDAPALHAMVADLLQELSARDQILAQMQTIKLRQEQLLADYRQDNLYKDAKITKLSHEIAMLRRVRFGKSGEQLSGVQGSLLEETVQTDLSAIEAELELLHGVPLHEPKSANKPVRTRLPEHLPRVTIIHEPDSTVCQCGCQ